MKPVNTTSTWSSHAQPVAIGIVATLCALSILKLAGGALGSYDQYWHLQTGADFLFNRLTPFVDHYSYSFAGEPIKQQPYLFQFLYALLHKQFGFDEGTRYLRSLTGLTLLATVFLFGRAIRAPLAFRALALAASTYFLVDRFFPRPELFDQILIVMGFYLASFIDQEMTHKRLLFALAFMLAWINFHAGIIAYTIFLYPFVQALVRKVRGEHIEISTRQIFLWGALFTLVGFVNKDLLHPIFYAASFSDAWSAISEHRSSRELLQQKPLLIAYWTCSVVVIAWSFLSRNYGMALTALILTYASIDRARMINLSGLSLTCSILILSVSLASRGVAIRIRPSIYKLVNIAVWSATVALLITLLYKPQPVKNQPLDMRAPTDVVNKLRTSFKGGDILNEYAWGGYLLYALSPNYKVFIDGRTQILYSPEFYSSYRKLAAPDNKLLERLTNDLAPDFAVWSIENAPHRTLVNDLELQVNFIGNRHLLYSKTGDHTRLATLLKYPMCVTESDIEDMFDMVSSASTEVSRDFSMDILRLVEEEYAASLEKTIAGILSGNLKHPNSDKVVRLLAHSQVIQGNFSTAADAWSLILGPETRDAIYSSYAHIKAGRFAKAKELLTLVTSDPWQSYHPLTAAQIFRIKTLLAMLKEQGESMSFSNPDAHSIWIDLTPSNTEFITPENIIYKSHCDKFNLAG